MHICSSSGFSPQKAVEDTDYQVCLVIGAKGEITSLCVRI